MRFVEDPRVRVGLKGLALAWIYFFLYLTTIMLTSYVLDIRPFVWGLPRWVFYGNILVPILFVVFLIFVVEKCIPDISLTDNEDRVEEKK